MMKSSYDLKYLLIVVMLAIVCSCDSALDDALESSGNNRAELESVITHYKGDKQKQRAAKYLIENMIGKKWAYNSDTTLIAQVLDVAATTLDSSGWSPTNSSLIKALQPYNIDYNKSVFLLDLENISSQYLISNIDQAFEQWNQVPWSSRYSFSQFCDYVLPYRVASEGLVNWRSMALERNILQDATLGDDMFDIAVYMYDYYTIVYNYGMSKLGYSMDLGQINHVQKGNCGHIASGVSFYLSAYGIPNAVDCIPAWANRSSDHIWNAVIYPDGSSRATTIHPIGINEIYYKISKIYRKSFRNITNELTNVTPSDIPPFFRDNNLVDVTSKYNIHLSDVEVSKLNKFDTEIVYLNTFNNYQWVPVAYAQKRGSKAHFRDMGNGSPVLGVENKQIVYVNQGDGVVYLPTYYKNGQSVVAASPFILDSKGNATQLQGDKSKPISIELDRKYPKNPEFDYAERRIKGGHIVASESSGFEYCDTLATISNVATHHSFDVESSKKYRYIKFVPSNMASDTVGIQIAEISCYGIDDRPICTKPIYAEALHLFDGDKLTFYWKPCSDSHHKMSGVFDNSQTITKIEISAMNDDNDIVIGQDYELYYWDSGWRLIDQVRATSNKLHFDNIPQGALLYIKNITKGVEQRIFTYENGKQIWW